MNCIAPRDKLISRSDMTTMFTSDSLVIGHTGHAAWLYADICSSCQWDHRIGIGRDEQEQEDGQDHRVRKRTFTFNQIFFLAWFKSNLTRTPQAYDSTSVTGQRT